MGEGLHSLLGVAAQQLHSTPLGHNGHTKGRIGVHGGRLVNETPRFIEPPLSPCDPRRGQQPGRSRLQPVHARQQSLCVPKPRFSAHAKTKIAQDVRRRESRVELELGSAPRTRHRVGVLEVRQRGLRIAKSCRQPSTKCESFRHANLVIELGRRHHGLVREFLCGGEFATASEFPRRGHHRHRPCRRLGGPFQRCGNGRAPAWAGRPCQRPSDRDDAGDHPPPHARRSPLERRKQSVHRPGTMAWVALNPCPQRLPPATRSRAEHLLELVDRTHEPFAWARGLLAQARQRGHAVAVDVGALVNGSSAGLLRCDVPWRSACRCEFRTVAVRVQRPV